MDSEPANIWKLSTTRAITLDRPCVVCILNVTPDSFADGGKYSEVESALDRAKQAVDEGADMLDVGGESTRPGAARVNTDEQRRRVAPVIEAIRSAGIDVPISIDTTRAAVARAAIEAGADAVNDVSAMTEDPAMLGVIVEKDCGVVLMHRKTTPDRDSYSDEYLNAPEYSDVVGEVCDVLDQQAGLLIEAGVERGRIVVDPGLGFGKSVEDNLLLIARTDEILGLGYPVMSGLSRKSFVGRAALGRDSEPWERVRASAGMSVVHLQRGARIFRVHDVKEHRAALDGAWAILGVQSGAGGG